METSSLRTESRGAHFRSDYPERNDADWMLNLFASQKNCELSIRKEWINADNGWTDEPGDIRISPWG